MKPTLKAVYARLGRPAPARLAAALGLAAVLAFGAAAYFGGLLAASFLSLLMSLVTLVALAVVWSESRRTREELRAAGARTEVTCRRILAAIEAERLDAERRHTQSVPGAREPSV